MQLIVDADNIDIERNMSTIEQEPLSEKFLTNKVVDHLGDDITTGNKENIQKQENIILDVEEDNVIDTEKQITTSSVDVLTNDLGIQNANETTVHAENVETSEEITKDNLESYNVESNAGQVPDDLITEKVNEKESLLEQNTENLKELNNAQVLDTELTGENETNPVISNKNSIVMEDSTVKEIDNMEISVELNEENNVCLDKEVDISELSTELNEEKAMDVDKEVDIAELSNELNKENSIELDDTSTVMEKKSVQKEIPNVDDKDQEVDCTTTVLADNNETNEKNTAIEIEDEDEESSEKDAQIDQKVLKVQENADKTDEAEIVEETDKSVQEDNTAKKVPEKPEQTKRICRLSNNLDIFSDEEDDGAGEEPPKDNVQPVADKQCINVDDDDDVMVIAEDTSTKDSKNKDTNEEVKETSISNNNQLITENTSQPKNEINASLESNPAMDIVSETAPSEIETVDVKETKNETPNIALNEENKMAIDKIEEPEKNQKPLLPKNFINTCKKNLSDMTRNDLEEFCILKIVESIVDRSNLGEIKAHLKNLTQTMEECKKKCLMLSKQNKDLQVVLKSVQEEQKSGSDVHITPLKITRSVGMQVVMVADRGNLRKKSINGVGAQAPLLANNTKQVKNQQNPNIRNQKEKTPLNQQIPVPRLVPATPPTAKTIPTVTNTTAAKQVNNTALPNGMRNSPPVQKIPEKRPRSQAVTVDLTDDEPPPKLQNVQRGPMNQPMRVLTTAPNLIPPQRFNQSMNSPRKVYIPISGPQAQNVRPGQTIMLKTLPGLAPRPRAQAQALITKSPQTASPVRYPRGQPNRHPAPLPDAMKQYQPPNWKSLPPAPDLKLSKVENGIVISWKIDGYQEDNHEEIASYQLYAYQETSSPPNTALWKKIGDVKALPLPMACTLTQFMAGYKYYFAVRAVDIRSRFGPFSLPGSILLLNKM